MLQSSDDGYPRRGATSRRWRGRGDALVVYVMIQPLREAFGLVLELRDDH